jgi:hypothetical protein
MCVCVCVEGVRRACGEKFMDESNVRKVGEEVVRLSLCYLVNDTLLLVHVTRSFRPLKGPFTFVSKHAQTPSGLRKITQYRVVDWEVQLLQG